MSILKSILHHYNKTSASYDTLHPETEVAQITDFADGIVSKLAATTAISAISALQTDSWFGKMMKWVLDTSGVKYLIDTNGYVCFGSFFGGLIIQWGFYNCNRSASFPLTFTSNTYRAVATIMASTTDINNYTVSIEHGSTGTFTLNGWRNGTKQSDIYASVVVLGK